MLLCPSMIFHPVKPDPEKLLLHKSGTLEVLSRDGSKWKKRYFSLKRDVLLCFANDRAVENLFKKIRIRIICHFFPEFGTVCSLNHVVETEERNLFTRSSGGGYMEASWQGFSNLTWAKHYFKRLQR